VHTEGVGVCGVYPRDIGTSPIPRSSRWSISHGSINTRCNARWRKV